jgi:phospholipid/cholesterol/gamma-HCH transport system permease protein
MTHAAAGASTKALAELRVGPDGLWCVVMGGNWSLEHPQPRFEELVAQAPGNARPPRLAFDSTALDEWDSSLLLFLMQCQAYAEQHGITLDMGGLPEQLPRLLALAQAVPERLQPKDTRNRNWLARFGTAALGVWSNTRDAVTFAGETAIAAAGLFTGRVHMRWRDFWVVVQANSSGALPIVTLIALLVGVIIAFLGVVVLKRFGAGYYVSYLVGFGMLREMGALMTGIIMAGRTGAAFAAELGSMKITEEIDAYTTLGISSVDQLVLPRMLGLFVMMPLLTIYADFVGIAGGILVSAAMLDLSPTQFMSGMLTAVTMSDALLGIFKGTVFGAVIGVAGCMKGLQTGSDASAVGRAATSAVVLGITGIIMANALIDWLAALLDI